MQNNNEIVLDHGCRSRMSTAFFLATLPFGIYNRRKTYNKIESGEKYEKTKTTKQRITIGGIYAVSCYFNGILSRGSEYCGYSNNYLKSKSGR